MKQSFCSLLLLALAFGAAQTSLFAQNETPQREVGLRFGSLSLNNSDFSAFYKKQKSENVYRRIRVFAADLTTGVIDEDFLISFSAGLAIGREKRKTLDPKLIFFQGPEFNLALGLQYDLENDIVLISPGLGYVFGLQHNFNDRWAVNIETVPGISASVAFATESETGALLFNAGFNNRVALSILRRF
jgi:hypothetical protein